MESKNIVFPQRGEVALLSQPIDPPGPREIQCRAEVSLISIGTELRCLHGRPQEGTSWSGWVKYPFLPGYSMAATVVAVGADVTEYQVGDRVAAFQEHTQFFNEPVDNNKFLHKIPDGIAFEEAAWMGIGGCITQTCARRSELHLGESVGIIGLGMLGQMITQYIRLMGADEIIAIDANASRLEMARRHGADHTLCMYAQDAIAEVRRLTGGRMLDVVYDVTGLPQVLASACQMARKQGRIMVSGDTTRTEAQAVGPNFLKDSLNIYATHADNGADERYWNKLRMADFFYRCILRGRMEVKSMNTAWFSPAEAPEVYRWLHEDKPDAMGVLFDWTKL